MTLLSGFLSLSRNNEHVQYHYYTKGSTFPSLQQIVRWIGRPPLTFDSSFAEEKSRRYSLIIYYVTADLVFFWYQCHETKGKSVLGDCAEK